MATDVRKAWQDFKKRNPKFEKARPVKRDLGPLLDSYAKRLDELKKAQAAYADRRAAANKSLQDLGGSIDEVLLSTTNNARGGTPSAAVVQADVAQYQQAFRDYAGEWRWTNESHAQVKNFLGAIG